MGLLIKQDFQPGVLVPVGVLALIDVFILGPLLLYVLPEMAKRYQLRQKPYCSCATRLSRTIDSWGSGFCLGWLLWLLPVGLAVGVGYHGVPTASAMVCGVVVLPALAVIDLMSELRLKRAELLYKVGVLTLQLSEVAEAVELLRTAHAELQHLFGSNNSGGFRAAPSLLARPSLPPGTACDHWTLQPVVDAHCRPCQPAGAASLALA